MILTMFTLLSVVVITVKPKQVYPFYPDEILFAAYHCNIPQVLWGKVYHLCKLSGSQIGKTNHSCNNTRNLEIERSNQLLDSTFRVLVDCTLYPGANGSYLLCGQISLGL